MFRVPCDGNDLVDFSRNPHQALKKDKTMV